MKTCSGRLILIGIAFQCFSMSGVGLFGSPSILGEAAVQHERRKGCDRDIQIKHGFTTFVENDNVALFECLGGYVPYGDMKATCLKNGKWDSEPPKCIKKGCEQLKIPIHGKSDEDFSGALVTFNCDSGYELEGDSVLTCDGKKWSSQPPSCKPLPPKIIQQNLDFTNKSDL